MINPIDMRIQHLPLFEKPVSEQELNVNTPTFLDIFKSIAGEAAAAQEVKAQDILDIMLGDVDDLERVQTNITKAQVSLELLTSVRNSILDAYNDIIKMGI